MAASKKKSKGKAGELNAEQKTQFAAAKALLPQLKAMHTQVGLLRKGLDGLAKISAPQEKKFLKLKDDAQLLQLLQGVDKSALKKQKQLATAMLVATQKLEATSKKITAINKKAG